MNCNQCEVHGGRARGDSVNQPANYEFADGKSAMEVWVFTAAME